MAERPIYGLTHSENGWQMVDQGSCKWVRIPGAEHVSLQIREGTPLVIMRAFAADYHRHVEPLRDADSACWTPTNSVASSNHLSGTAMDLNWNGADGKTFRLGISEERAYPPPKNIRLRELLEFYEGNIFCGGAWSIRDWMHFQMGGGTYNTAKAADFIKRKIRGDGFSTFKRSDVGNVESAVSILASAIGVNIGLAEALWPDIRVGLELSECNTPRRIAHWLAQVGHESITFTHTEEIDKNGRYKPYIGRTWIQITWDYNYRDFGKWCVSKGLISDPELFVRDPESLASLRWRAIGPAWYWTVQRPMNALVDAGEAAIWKAGNTTYRGFQAVTAAINGGLNGLADRQARYDRAIALGDRLLAITQGDDELADPALVKKINEIHAALFNPIPSQSIYRNPDEKARWQLHELIKNDDGMIHQEHVERSARYGNLTELGRIIRAARGEGADRSAWVIAHATAVLGEIEQVNPQALQQYLAWEAEQELRGAW